MDASVAQEIAQWSPNEDITLGVRVKIFQLITDFLAEKKSWGRLSFHCLKEFYCGFSAILHLSNIENDFHIKVDLVPLLSCDQRWYVFKDGSVSESVALKELEHMRSLPPNAREGYMMTKSLRDVHLLGHMIHQPILSDLVDRVLPLHTLKHALFHAFAREEASLKPHEWAERTYIEMMNEWLTNFFSGGTRLFKDGVHLRQMHLNLFIQRRRSDLQAFSTAMETDLRVLFIGEILKMFD